MPPKPLAIRDRISRMVRASESGCWLWTGTLTWRGYGFLIVAGRKLAAHRASYEAHVGPIPAGLQIDHLCRIRNCVNPSHLEPVTQRENLRRGNHPMATALSTDHCINGHALDASNTYIRKEGARCCRTCRRAADRRYRLNKGRAI